MKFSTSLILLALIALGSTSCGKHKMPTVVNPTANCVVINCPSYFGTTQTFTYDNSRLMTGRTYDFGYPGYGPFTQTVDKKTVFSSYTHSGGVVQETDVFVGGTGNLYDGMPAFLVKSEHQTSTSGPNVDLAPDTTYGFHYDAKKRLDEVFYYPDLLGGSVYEIYSRQLYVVALQLTYDDNNNVTKLKQIDVNRQGNYNVNSPSESYFWYDSVPRNVIDVTYDSKPSPFSAVLKYWKFVQNDWGLATNSNWSAIITALSPNNPLTIKYEVQQYNPSTTIYTMVYNYNDHGLPADSYKYDCQ